MSDYTQEEIEKALRRYWAIKEGLKTLPERREKVRIAKQTRMRDLTLDIIQKGKLERGEML